MLAGGAGLDTLYGYGGNDLLGGGAELYANVRTWNISFQYDGIYLSNEFWVHK